MKSYGISILILALTAVLLSGNNVKNKVITTGSLFAEMIDMENLARYPDPSFKTIQFSSYDRHSKLAGGPNWFANNDGFGGEKTPNFEKVLKEPDANGVGEYLIADVQGPGAIVRLWTAYMTGTVRMYIDGAPTPIFDGKGSQFFKSPYDHFPEFRHIDKKIFSKTVRQRDASYAPIPFAKRLRVVWIGKIKETHFYQMQVRLFKKGARVESFAPRDILKYQKRINHTAGILADPDKAIAKGSAESFSIDMKSRENKEALHLKGPGAAARMTLKISAKNVEKALRQTLLYIFFDDHRQAQVQTPVGDFFGAAPGINPYQSLPFTVQADCTMVCRYLLPYKTSCRIMFKNLGDQQVNIQGSVLPVPYEWKENSMHFYARWRANHDMIASNEEVVDIPFLVAVGKGKYVGSTSLILNPTQAPNPWGGWWGEGDEKIFVDDDTFPSTFGTGSEDYYNYSWSSPDIFYFPYCGQPRNDGPGNRGFVTNYRYHILDCLPFANSIRFYMELFPHRPTPGFSYARIGYYYARPGGSDDHLPIGPGDLIHLQLPDSWKPIALLGSRDTTFYEVEDMLTSKAPIQMKNGRLWAGGKIMVWNPEKKLDMISIKIPVLAAGKKRIRLTVGMTPSSGKFVAFFNKKPIQFEGKSEIVDLQRPFRILSRTLTLKPRILSQKDHILTLVYHGTSAKVRIPEIAIDFIWVQNLK